MYDKSRVTKSKLVGCICVVGGLLSALVYLETGQSHPFEEFAAICNALGAILLAF